jgi:hypothetical protein
MILIWRRPAFQLQESLVCEQHNNFFLFEEKYQFCVFQTVRKLSNYQHEGTVSMENEMIVENSKVMHWKAKKKKHEFPLPTVIPPKVMEERATL